jgi:transcription-repair coupling factor (superfamily II helicase)
MLLSYQGEARLYLPVHRFGEVHRYVAAEGRPPRLDRLGGASWQRSRRKVADSVRKLAEELLQLYAQRDALPGHAVATPDELYRAFEATFPFTETPDQREAIEAVEQDLQRARPMDRLVCGDVGYGKTEVALRAAMLTVLDGRQVAMLAPTTVLVEQHLATFAERLKSFPVKVAGLSRFRPRAAQQRTLAALAVGEVDIVVGTHRLLSADVRFDHLGLVIVDEEQRFGVAHKERLKQLRTQVDVLTLTATPIPRTLHMSLLGMRDLSLITTPPSDRLAVRTHVCVSSPQVIRDAIRRELSRGGQVYFVVPHIGEAGGAGGAPPPGAPRPRRSLSQWAEQIRELVPEARVAEAHGQLDDRALERVMAEFVAGRHDVLVCTSLVESGLDISRANTMFIQDADRFGLAQLYQLRGRIGRGRDRAYCLLMVSSLSAITPEARQRLEALQRFSDLGAGFNLASTDLEIRGTGDLLGGKQSGNIASVGFEEYSRIMEEAVAELRGEPLQRAEDPDLVSDVPSFIPDDYVEEPAHRLHFYRRLADVESETDAQGLLEEMADRFGAPPPEVPLLADLMVVKALARRLAARAVELTGGRLTLVLDERTRLDPGFVRDLVSPHKSRWRFTPDHRLTKNLEAEQPAERLQESKNCLHSLMAGVR